jgi:Ni/Fe-hydrogenase 1 B-type cytochrome subunit
MEERYLRHDASERIVHWLMALSITLLIISGLSIRFPGFLGWGTMNTARFIHFIFMYVLIFSWIFHVYHTLRVECKEEIIGVNDIKGFPRILKYYLFLSDDHPLYTKYNPVQKLAYNILWILILIQVVTGLALYWPEKFMGFTHALGGIMAFRILHDFLTYIFISFIIVHVYMALLEDVRSVWAMFHGYYYRKTSSGRSQ